MLVGSQVARFNTAPSPRVFSMEHAENALEFAEGYDYIAVLGRPSGSGRMSWLACVHLRPECSPAERQERRAGGR